MDDRKSGAASAYPPSSTPHPASLLPNVPFARGGWPGSGVQSSRPSGGTGDNQTAKPRRPTVFEERLGGEGSEPDPNTKLSKATTLGQKRSRPLVWDTGEVDLATGVSEGSAREQKRRRPTVFEAR